MQRQSSKKKKDNQKRASELRATTSPIPIPRRAGEGLTPDKRQSKRFGTFLKGDSVASLPQASSIRSSVSVMSDNHYEVGSVDVFSARPKIRYSLQSQYASGALRSPTQSRVDTRWEKQAASRRDLASDKTIDTLADDYDTGTLRELMERDQRRRERKRKNEEDRARRRLERHAARQADPSSSNQRDRPRSRRKNKNESEMPQPEGLGLQGVEPGPSLGPEERRSPAEDEDGLRPVKATENELRPIKTTEDESRPVETAEDLSRPEPAERASVETSPIEEPVVETAREVRMSQASMSPPRSPQEHDKHASMISQMAEPLSESKSKSPLQSPVEPGSYTSDISTRRAGGLASLFRRSGAGKPVPEDRGRTSPSNMSFSNTSRESMRFQAPPSHLREQPSFQRPRSGTPTRTRSKFREDLPELPISPPDSRLQSPGVAEVAEEEEPRLSARQREKLPEGGRISTVPLEKEEGHRDSTGSAAPPSAVTMSQSLASVDSEGSWLSSSKMKKRGSQQLSSTPGTLAESREFDASGDDRTRSMGSIGAVASTEGGEAQDKIGDLQGDEDRRVVRGEVERHSAVLHHQSHTKSSEGLLRQFNASGTREEEAPSPDTAEASPTSLDELPTKSTSHEAQHARTVSGGSAKLLDISSNRGSMRSEQGRTPPPT